MKKILFVIPTMRMGGAEQSLVSLLNAIESKKYDIDLLLFEKNGELIDRLPNNINIIEADTLTRAMTLEFRHYFKDLIKEKYFLSAIMRIVMLINSKLEDLTGKKIFFNWNIAKRVVKKLSGQYDVAVGYLEGITNAYIIDKVDAKRKIGWIHTDFRKSSRHFKAEGSYYKKLDQIVIISEECRKHFIDYYPDVKGKTIVVENITDRNAVFSKSKEEVDEKFLNALPIITTVGRLERVKGIDLAIEAASILRNRNINFSWHVFGDGFLKDELQRRINDLKLQEYFSLDGITQNPYKYMRCSDIIVQPSRNEGKSMVLDEAKFLAKPIVVTNYPSAEDQIVNNITGIIVEITPTAIADGIEMLLKDQLLREKLSENCKNEPDITEMIVKKVESMLEGE